MNFDTLHHQEKPLLICNVWDVASAKLAEKLNFQAIGTSSGAIANMLGYQDGEEMSFDELEYIVTRIVESVNIPLSVDLEAGYSRNPSIIATHILRLSQLGVVGVNIEDSLITNQRKLVDTDSFTDLLTEIILILRKHQTSIFINIRTDTYLLETPNALEETVKRATKYGSAGANGIFVPGITNPKEISILAQKIPLPLNVMCMPDLTDFSTLHKLGVHRISMGNFVYNKSVDLLEKSLLQILTDNSFSNLFVS